MSEELKQELQTSSEEISKPTEYREGYVKGLETQLKQLKDQLGSFESLKNEIEKEKSEAEKKKLLEQEKFEEVRNLFEQEKSQLAKELESLRQETLAKDLKFALSQKGLKHDKALKMFVNDYLGSDEKPSIEDYVESIANDESNKVFFENDSVRRPGEFAPSSSGNSANSSQLTLAKRLAMGNDDAAFREVMSLPENKRQEIVDLSLKLVREK